MRGVVSLVKMVILKNNQVFLGLVRVLKQSLKCLPAFKYLDSWMELFAVDHLKWAFGDFEVAALTLSFKSVQEWVHNTHCFALLP